MSKPILCLDFDGVIHSYTSGWQGEDVIPDRPVKGVFEFLDQARKYFTITIYSSRSKSAGGRLAMKNWLRAESVAKYGIIPKWLHDIDFPMNKPPAFLTIDDRALTFNGHWDSYNVEELIKFKPWNKK